ncbi:DUF4846 domain-containing protein [candidate division KSB1 bacterium]|nr:DUF4846 domain-containing protein [candidate division KSB1 bacterium]
MQSQIVLVLSALTLAIVSNLFGESGYTWLAEQQNGEYLHDRIAPPPGYRRLAVSQGSFAAWLRGLPLRPQETPVRLFDGRLKTRQDAVFAVVDIDVGSRDLQQCADAIIRLRAEYLWSAGFSDRIAFNFTSGHAARWPDWRAGLRPVVKGSDVSWISSCKADSSYASFRRYLDRVFIYAGSYSLARELQVVTNPDSLLPGDVFIQGGFPGHAVLVADVAENEQGERVFLLLQSYMPAQDIHILTNPANNFSAWYTARRQGTIVTPEWTFSFKDIRRFP